MTKAVQRRKGTAAEHTSFTGLEGEITINTTRNTMHVHDGSTAGGFEAALANGSNIVLTSTTTNIIPTTDDTYDLGSSTKQWRNLYLDGTANIDALVADTADINGGTVDSVTIGGTTAGAGSFTTGTFSGEITANGGIALGDNDKATFGDGDDLQIFHDGNHSWIKDAGTGNIYISSDGYAVHIVKGDNIATVASFIPDGPVNLYNAGALKLTTTATGIDVTGTATMDGLIVDGSVDINSGVLDLDTNYSIRWGGAASGIYSGAGTADMVFTAGSSERFRVNGSSGNVGIGTTSPTNGKLVIQESGTSVGSTIRLIGTNTTGSASQVSHITSYQPAGGAAEASALDFKVRGTDPYATPSTVMTLLGGGKVGIGTSSPATNLHIQSASEPAITLFHTGIMASQIGLDSTGSLTFGIDGSTGATERMRIDSNGRVGIGTSSPNAVADLHVADTSDARIWIDATSADTMELYAGTGVGMYNRSNSYLVLGTNNTERMRIDSSGNLLVGTTSNIVNANARAAFIGPEGLRAEATVGGGSACIGAFATSSGGTYYYIGYDLTASATKYQVLFNGNVQNTNNSYGAISDAKLKENVTDATPKLEKLNQVRVVNFNLIGDEQKQIGVIAQELEQIFPSIVEDTPDCDAEGNDLGTTTKSVKYSVFVPMLIKAIQEQQTIIESLTARITTLEGA
jgi:hypothetical protein